MTWYDVDTLSTTIVSSTIGSEDESIGNNTGTPILLIDTTKTSSEWGGLEGWESVKANSYGVLQTCISTLQSHATTSGNDIDLDGIYIELIDV